MLMTRDRAADDYPDDTLVDMEASAFLGIATRYASSELVQVLKVVSDNREKPHAQVAADQVESLISACLPVADATTAALNQLSAQLDATISVPESPRLTQSQQRLCRDLLRRWQALAGSPFDLDQLPTSLSSRDWLQRLREQVDAQVLRWP